VVLLPGDADQTDAEVIGTMSLNSNVPETPKEISGLGMREAPKWIEQHTRIQIHAKLATARPTLK